MEYFETQLHLCLIEICILPEHYGILQQEVFF